MTEYDFSPEAYERYLEKQNNISRWLDKTRRYVPSNPFFPTTPAAQYASLRTHGLDNHNDRTDHNRHHKSHYSYSSNHQNRRHRSSEPSSSHHRSASYPIPTAPPPPAIDRRTDVYYRRAPQPNPAVYQQHYPAPSRPLRSNTAPVYLHPAPGRNSYATAHPNPMAPHANTRRVGSGRSGRSRSTTHTGTGSHSSKREPLFKRLFGGIIGRHGHESSSYTARGNRRETV